mmetsp:Transcript_30981/g.81095  ORF Transcript_30981/g.81095 Transcript_30981/m.81095 type:complete len:213 (-) Transcript_30981:146-784(-)
MARGRPSSAAATSRGGRKGRAPAKKGDGSSSGRGGGEGGGLNARKQRNRESALRSRQKKQQVIVDAQQQILQLATTKEILATRVAHTRAEVEALKTQLAAARATADQPAVDVEDAATAEVVGPPPARGVSPLPPAELFPPAAMEMAADTIGDEAAGGAKAAADTTGGVANDTSEATVAAPLLNDFLDGLLDPLAVDTDADGADPLANAPAAH